MYLRYQPRYQTIPLQLSGILSAINVYVQYLFLRQSVTLLLAYVSYVKT